MEKPIRFTTNEVLATLDGLKTTKRLLVKPRYVDGDAGFNIVTNSKTGAFCYIEYYDYYERSTDRRMTPPFHVDDILWVRETWSEYCGIYWHKAGLEVDENGDCKDGFWVNDISEPSGKKWVATKAPDKWRPSIHMPREAARIFLRVTNVRVERLHDMNDNDVRCEGFANPGDFIRLWDGNIKPADRERYGWAANPFCWVIEFERCERPQE